VRLITFTPFAVLRLIMPGAMLKLPLRFHGVLLGGAHGHCSLFSLVYFHGEI
jgi:hypothetical protein